MTEVENSVNKRNSQTSSQILTTSKHIPEVEFRNMGFSWKEEIAKAEVTTLRRARNMAKTNPDFQARYPELKREVDQGTSTVEIKKYVKKRMDKIRKYAEVPKPSPVKTRFNRVV